MDSLSRHLFSPVHSRRGQSIIDVIFRIFAGAVVGGQLGEGLFHDRSDAMTITQRTMIDIGLERARKCRASQARRVQVAALTAVFAFMTGATVEAADKWAVLIGVSDYIYGDRMDLKGPVNDVQMMRELLLTKFNFPTESIRTLVDADATKANIISAFMDIGSKAETDDSVFIYYSGHGSQVPDLNGDEADGRDEVLCPADVRPGFPGAEISDDELNKLFSRIKATDITVVFDACHAGTGTRSLSFEESASAQPLQHRVIDLGYPEPEGGTRALSFEADPDGMDMLVEEVPATDVPVVGTRSLTSSGRQFTMIASCAPSETSASTVFYEGITRFWSGILTYNLVQALKKADGETTYEDLMASVLRDVKKINRSQSPQIEGAGARSVFSNTSAGVSARSYIRVTGVKGNKVTMRANSFAERSGSIYRVLASDGKAAGRVRITSVLGTMVEGEMIEGQGNITAPSLAVQEFKSLSEEKLNVRVGEFGDSSINKAMRDRLEKIDFVWVARTDTHYADIKVAGEIDGSVVSLLAGYEITAWLEEGGVRSRSVTSRDVNEVMGVLRPLLENAYAIKKLTRMDNDSPPFNVAVWASKSPTPGKGRDKFLEMSIGDPVYFHFKSDKDTYLTMLNVGADGGITILFPNEYVPFNRVVAGKTYTIPTPEMGFQLNLGGPPGQELVKVFATDFPMELSALNAQVVGGFRALEFEGSADGGYGPSVVDGLASAINGSFADNVPDGMRAIMLSAASKAEAPPPGTLTENWATDYLIIDAR